MKNNKCPYCSKRISYITAFSSRRKAEYVCEKCGRESRVVINRKVIFAFALAALIAIAIMLIWVFSGLSHNPLGILLTALPLVIFAVLSPKFVRLAPLKKYKKSMEARKAGIEYSDNLVSAELEENDSLGFGSSADSGSDFNINFDVFNEIKAERNAAREKLTEEKAVETFEDGKVPEQQSFVPVINDVTEKHATDDAPLKKLRSDGAVKVSRSRHYIPQQETEPKKPDGNKYSANRKF